jgi:hypothetical protein
MGLEVLAIGAMVAGTGMAAYGTYQAGKAAEAEGKSAQQWSEYNAKVEERNATAKEQAAAYREKQMRLEGDKIKGTQRALYATSGVTAEGTPLEVMLNTAGELEMDYAMTRREGYLEGQQHRSQAVLDRFEGKVARMKGSNAKTAANWQAGATLLSGLGSAGYAGSQMGKPSGKAA